MQLNLRRAWITIPGLALCLALGAVACASEPAPAPTAEPPAAMMMEEPKVDVDALKVEVVAHYANGVHGLYAQSLASAKVMDTAIDAFIADPNPASLEAAKRAWLRARDDYGPPRCSGSTAVPSTTKKTAGGSDQRLAHGRVVHRLR